MLFNLGTKPRLLVGYRLANRDIFVVNIRVRVFHCRHILIQVYADKNTALDSMAIPVKTESRAKIGKTQKVV